MALHSQLHQNILSGQGCLASKTAGVTALFTGPTVFCLLIVYTSLVLCTAFIKAKLSRRWDGHWPLFFEFIPLVKWLVLKSKSNYFIHLFKT